MVKCVSVCVHVRSIASFHISLFNYLKLPNIGSNRVDIRRRQLIDDYEILPKNSVFYCS